MFCYGICRSYLSTDFRVCVEDSADNQSQYSAPVCAEGGSEEVCPCQLHEAGQEELCIQKLCLLEV